MNTPKIEAVNIDQRGRLVITLAPAAQGQVGQALRAKGAAAIATLAKTEQGEVLSKQRAMLSAAQTTATKATADASGARQRIAEALARGDDPALSEELLAAAVASEAVARHRITVLTGCIERSEADQDSAWQTIRQQVTRDFLSESATRFESAKAELATILDDNCKIVVELAGAVECKALSENSMEHASYLATTLLKPSKPTAVPAAPAPKMAPEVRPPRPDDFAQPPRCLKCGERGGVSSGAKGVQIHCEACSTEIVVPPDHPFQAMLTGAGGK